ncbi:MAG: aminotransferase class I/II-fold pyridoxal phosphate-dependent enzyme [Pseudomonadales bacterium]|jgi:aspartate/methionine/tyrosine aminotransferase|nr:aminotransferase class I/II-fold pyridoxal phosphate-dependent enzyme [Pseudomonadales bacterium]MDP7360308.1 aminotransferase class I/II-fold pyridoxal phosphate-dependent enzyme [Pseudomonadales bacterium]MDP7597580.1 aminotransferase class I/II-fold pyridoxal phosphate-dependent enzyme [Pseudomonadales bacterium]HJN50794.1 aminotransferase class I/II-fold pyridoxal phosphate-dependent enzyme [Pseudomonadales bacterium]|tara:strand:+ start:560 stop:1738 length:1179 start_codon:yes stop_codon:yes gene_type:complete
MKPFRAEVEALQQNGITRVALPHITDPDIIPLWFGEGDMVTPEFIREAAKSALDGGQTFYCHTRGTEDFRDAIKLYLDKLYGVDLARDRISVPGSAMLGITIAAQMALTSGSHALIVSPNWPNIENVYRVTGAEVSFIRQREESDGWCLSAREIIDHVKANTGSIYVNSPCNPTGWVMSADDQAELLEFCRKRQILIIADEVYHRLIYDGDTAPSFISIARDDDPVVIVNGLSKAWAMTGWRVGWVVAPSHTAQQWAILSECFNTGATAFVQPAGIAALQQGEQVVGELRNLYRQGRELVMQILAEHPAIELSEPVGSFYAFPRIEGLRDSYEFAKGVLAEERVGIAPGYTFGPGNEAYFRICFAQSHERLRQGLEGVIRYIDRHVDELLER